MLTDQPGSPAAWGGQAELWWDLHPRRDRRAACAAQSRPPPPGPAASPRLPAGPGGRAQGRAESD